MKNYDSLKKKGIFSTLIPEELGGGTTYRNVVYSRIFSECKKWPFWRKRTLTSLEKTFACCPTRTSEVFVIPLDPVVTVENISLLNDSGRKAVIRLKF
jgi:hypothetical protein